MAEKSGYGKFQDSISNEETDTYGDPPPAYNETAMSPVKTNLSSAPVQPYPPEGAYVPPPPAEGNFSPPPPPQGYYAPPPPPQAPVQVFVPTPAPTVSTVVVQTTHLPPGTCTVCRKGKIEDTASCCTWFWCCLLLPLGILPGIIAFCCCCRRPKCSHCGFSI
ncbi:membrane protein BRI3-like [Palaemon carinicauda]|uniref:membrane protein BRI3-like n=1 Tax=Palaemon carinicauda TaxID=392227 RepID=UPI0035B60154